MNALILAAVTTTADYMARWNVYPSDDTDQWITQALKTVGYYERVMYGLVLDLYKMRIPVMEFEQAALQLISMQYRRAWNEGLRLAGLFPMDMTAAMENELQTAVANELNHLRGLIDDVLQAQRDGSPVTAFHHRVDMWADRYTDIRSRALVAAGNIKPLRLAWRRGPTSDSCVDCSGYDGQVKTAQEWDEIFRTKGHRPGAIELGCKGFKCLCEFEVVD